MFKITPIVVGIFIISFIINHAVYDMPVIALVIAVQAVITFLCALVGIAAIDIIKTIAGAVKVRFAN